MTAPTLLELQDRASTRLAHVLSRIEDPLVRTSAASEAGWVRAIVAQAYGVVPSTPLGLPDSAITQLLQHIEMSMLSEGVDPETTTRVINKLLFGHPDGLPPRQGPGAPAAIFPEPWEVLAEVAAAHNGAEDDRQLTERIMKLLRLPTEEETSARD